MSGEGGGLLPVGEILVGPLVAIWSVLIAPILGIGICLGGFIVSFPQAMAWESAAQSVPGHVFFWPWIAFLAGALLPWIVGYFVLAGSVATIVYSLKEWRDDLVGKHGEVEGKKKGNQLTIGVLTACFIANGLVVWWFASMIAMYSQYQ